MSGVVTDIFIPPTQEVLPCDSGSSPIPVRQDDPIVVKTPSQKQGASLSVSRTYVQFGDVPVYTTQTQWVTFTNNGSRTLRVSQIGTSDFAFSPFQSSLTIPPGESRSLKIDFTPMFEQNYTGFISFQSNDPDYSSGSIYVTGRGIRY